jgi:hypothetical protein
LGSSSSAWHELRVAASSGYPPGLFLDADIRCAFAAFALSIATQSSFEWHVLAGNIDPVTCKLRQIGFGGLAFSCDVAASAVGVGGVWADPATGTRISERAMTVFMRVSCYGPIVPSERRYASSSRVIQHLLSPRED